MSDNGTSGPRRRGIGQNACDRMGYFGRLCHALVPGVLRTNLNTTLLDATERAREFLLRTPMRRFGQLDELAGAAVFLASDAASFVTGHLLVVDGGIMASASINNPARHH